MKKIEAFLRPEKLQDIKDMLHTLNINGLSITQIMGCGSQKGWREYVRGTQVDYNFLPKIKIELVVLDDQVEPLMKQIGDLARTGEAGDGKIFIYDVQDAMRVRTGERGEKAVK